MNFYAGLDLGQAQDYTALAIVEKTQDAMEYHVRHLERFPLGTTYTDQVQRVIGIMQRIPGTTLIIDQTGVGRAVYDLFKKSGLSPIGVSIHGGDRATHDGGVWKVPKRDLVAALTVAFQNGELKIASSLPEASTLIKELQNFRVKIDPKTAHDSYEAWREGDHDDLVLAVALAVWYARRDAGGRRFPIGGATRR